MRHGQAQREPLLLLGNSHQINLVATLKWANGSTERRLSRMTLWSITFPSPPLSGSGQCPRSHPRPRRPTDTGRIPVPDNDTAERLPEPPWERPKYSDPNESGSDPDRPKYPTPTGRRTPGNVRSTRNAHVRR